MRRFRRFLLVLSLAAAPMLMRAPVPTPQPPAHLAAANLGIVNGSPRTTIDGQVVDAHDGQIQKFGSTYYLYGTAYACGFRWTDPSSSFCGFNVYSSPDLVQWTGPSQLFVPSADWQTLCMHGTAPGWGCFRPKVVFNAAAQRYVLWINVPGGYRTLTSPSPTGPFQLVSTPSVTGGDMGLFVDVDGTGYLTHSQSGRVFELRLTPDYLDVTGPPAELAGFPQVAPYYGAESPSEFVRQGVYYAVLSVPSCPYCSGTGTGYLTAPTAFGPWTYVGLLSDWSCDGQPAAVSDVGGVYLYQSDQWLETPNEYHANQFWTPLSFQGARITAVRCTLGPYPYLAYFPWYDSADPNVASDNIHVVNPASNGRTAVGAIAVGGQMLSFSIQPGQEWVARFRSGTLGGPVEVGSNVRVLASQRTQYGASFNEVGAQPAAAAVTDLYLSWFDRVSSPGFRGDDIHVVNPSSTPADVTVTIPGLPGCSVSATVAPGDDGFFTCPTGFGGPVRVHASVPVLASQRITYYQTFNEVDAQPGRGATTLVSAWYDHSSDTRFLADNVHVVSPAGALGSAGVHVSIPGCPAPSVWQYSPSEWIYSCPFGQGFGGPVVVTAALPVLVSQRVQYAGSFNEAVAQDPAASATTLYIPWFDLESSRSFTGDNIHVFAATGTLSPSAVSVAIPGCTAAAWQPAPAELIYTCPAGQGFGGPVVIRSTTPVLAAQRIEYAQSFNEAAAGSG